MKTRTDKSLLEVWQMKRAAYEETKALKGDAYFEHIHHSVAAAFPGVAKMKRVRYAVNAPLPSAMPCVADGRVEYRVRGKKSKQRAV